MEHFVFAGKWSRPRLVWIAALAGVLAVVLAGLVVRSRSSGEIAEVPFSDLLRDLDRGLVAEVVVNGDTLTFKGPTGPTLRTNAPASYVTLNPDFITDL